MSSLHDHLMHARLRRLGAFAAAFCLVALLVAPSSGAADRAKGPIGPPKLEPLPGSEGQDPESTRIPGHYIVVLRDSVEHPHTVAAKQTDQRHGDLGLVYSYALKGYSAELTKKAVESLRKSPNVRYVVPDSKVEALAQTIPSGIERSYATENEVADIDGEDTRVDVDVAVIDTGVDFEHPDLDVVGSTDCVPGAADGSLLMPRGVAVDPEGDVWVTDTLNNRVQEFSSSGEYLSKFGSSGTGPGQFDIPSGIAVDPEGNVWVADTLNNRIQGFSPEGELLQTIGEKGSGPGQFKVPWALTTDAEGNIYVADTSNHRIQKFDPEGEFLMTFGSKSETFPFVPDPGEFFEPSGIGVDAEGDIWVADTGNNRVQVFDPEGEFLFQFGATGSGNGQFSGPRNIAIDVAGNVWIADHRNFRVQKFDSEGEYLAQFGEVGSEPGQFGNVFEYGPMSVAVGIEGSLFVSDPPNDRVHKWSSGSPPTFQMDFGYGCVDGTAPDGYGHGTHVAGTIGAIDNGQGVVGVAPGARIWAVRVLDDNGGGALSWITAGIDWVAATREDEDPENDIEIANMSLGCPCAGSAKPIEEAISGYEEGKEHIPGAVDQGVVFVVSAGNSAMDVKDFSPAGNPDVITVSALADYDGEAGGLAEPLSQFEPRCEHVAEEDWEHFGADDTMATFSNWGDGVEIAAPGVCTLSTLPGGKYGYSSGTSMSSPHVAGAAALLASQSNPKDKEDVEAIRDTLTAEGSLDMSHTSQGPPAPLLYLGDEPLEDVEVATGGSEAVKSTTATIHGAIKPQGLATAYTLEYGTTTSYGKTAASGEVKAGESFARVSAGLSGLSSDTEYHFRLKATNSAGTFLGQDGSFTTKRVTYTTVAKELSESSAMLQGAVLLSELPESESTTYSFEYGVNTNYGQSVVAEIDESEPEWDELVYGEFYDPIAKKITGLGKATVYHYRAVATTDKGTFYGRDVVFRTAGWTKWTGKEKVPWSLDHLSCASANACMAIARDGGEAAWWDGKSWEELPEPPVGLFVTGVSCSAANFCMAVGFLGDFPRALSWDGEQWNELPNPPVPVGGYGQLEAVTCESANACVAVGGYYIPAVKEGYLALHWDGEEWSADVVPVAPPAGFVGVYLSDVECTSSTNCFAAGWRTLHWDGEEWSQAPAPAQFVDELSCVASSFCFGVQNEGLWGGIWDGEQWSSFAFDAIARPAHWVSVRDVSCATEWSCAVVGRERGEGGLEEDLRVALHWDGGDLAKEAVSNLTEEGLLGGVSCDSATHCLAVGTNGSNEGGRIENYDQAVAAPEATTTPATNIGSSSATLRGTVDSGALRTTYYFEYDTSEYKKGEGSHGTKAPASPKVAGSSTADIDVNEPIEGLTPKTTYHYRIVATNGKGTTYGEDQTFTTWGSWSLQSTPNVTQPAPENKLEAVSCASSSMCMGVGNDLYKGRSFGQYWNGTEWQTVLKSALGGISLYGVNCPSTTLCLVVGAGGWTEKWTYSAGTWSTTFLNPPSVGGATALALRDVSCTSTSACTGVGSYHDGTRRVTLAARWSGGNSWTVQSTPNAESGDTELLGVSCDGASSCTAVGRKAASGGQTFAARWNGSTWSASTTPNPGLANHRLEDVSCTSSSACTAVGSYVNNSAVQTGLALRWNGSTWSSQAIALPGGSKATYLNDVACTSSTHCTAVGRYNFATNEDANLVESWGGSEWQVQSSPNPEGKKLPQLSGVSCTASNACTAVGWGQKSSTDDETVTVAARYQ